MTLFTKAVEAWMFIILSISSDMAYSVGGVPHVGIVERTGA
jgi:hypothetical protein